MFPRDPKQNPSPDTKKSESKSTLGTLDMIRLAAREKIQKTDAQRSVDREFLLRYIRERLSVLSSSRA
jgi:hypothetical protein